MRHLSTTLITFLIFACTGCSWFNNEFEEKSVQELIQAGVEQYEKGAYPDAIKNFEQLKDWYPFSRYAILAELKIADSHYHLQQYQEAIAAYEEFEQLHPRNEAIPYIIYQIGRCYYEQIDTIDRDQSAAKKAQKTFSRLTRQFPNDPYALRSEAHIIRCLNTMAAHDFYVGEFYFKAKRYKAALQRFLSIISNYPDTGIHHKALLYITACETLISHTPESDT